MKGKKIRTLTMFRVAMLKVQFLTEGNYMYMKLKYWSNTEKRFILFMGLLLSLLVVFTGFQGL